MRYEGYAPGGVAVIVEALTDNRNRTAGEVRSYFTKAGGALAETGAVSFMFDRVGLIVFDRKVADDEAMLEAAIEAGADDVASGPEEHEVITSVAALRDAQKALEAKFGEPRRRPRSSGGRRTPSPSMTRRAKRSCASSARSKTTTTSRPSPRTSRCPRRYWRRWRASALRQAAQPSLIRRRSGGPTDPTSNDRPERSRNEVPNLRAIPIPYASRRASRPIRDASRHASRPIRDATHRANRHATKRTERLRRRPVVLAKGTRV